MSVNKTFKKIDTMIASGLPESETMFVFEKATLFGVNVLPTISYTLLKQHADTYDLLEEPSSTALVSAFDGFGIMVAGWAAPITENEDENEIRPSQHPEKIRVRLFTYMDAEGIVQSSIRFSDGREVVYDDSGRGTLRDAMCNLWECGVNYKKTLALLEES